MALPGTRREARERAVELLYEADTKSVHPVEVVRALPIRPDPYAVELATGVADHRLEIDSVLDRYSQRWPVSRMAAMDRSVLRVGVLELAVHLDVPTGACLSEAVELGSRYGSTDDTPKFVNGILAKVADEVRDGPRPWRPIDVVVFDMDGVIRHWTGEAMRAFEDEHGLEPGTVGGVAFSRPLYEDSMTGKLTAEEWAARIGEQIAQTHPHVDVDACSTMWLATEWRVDEEVVAIARALQDAGQRTAVFSNASTRLEQDMSSMGVAELFHHVANSSRIGLAKPDTAAFDHVAEQLDVPPHRLLFVDDREENVLGAIEAGWHAVQMRDAAGLGDVLRRLGV
ncbi:MAG TPA: transcription antitermination factor NusB, partial [Acidimicrobiales bacterium]|nr:transcription antitermination factor NusB [Acidimicrobiales bacterium]